MCSNFVICVWEPYSMEPVGIRFEYLCSCETFYGWHTLIGVRIVGSQRNIDYKYLNKFKFNNN